MREQDKKILTLIAIVALLLFIAFTFLQCSTEEAEPKPKTGCDTGISNITGTRVFIRCVTHDEYMKGSYGFPQWNNYTEHQWAECPDCK